MPVLAPDPRRHADNRKSVLSLDLINRSRSGDLVSFGSVVQGQCNGYAEVEMTSITIRIVQKPERPRS